LADIVTALCLLYLANSLADPSSLNSTKLASEISLPVVSDLTKIFEIPSLFRLSDKYCCTIIGYSFPRRLKVVILFPPYKVSSVLPIDCVDTPRSLALFLLITNFTSGLFRL
jgi:hypothetical protein